MIRWISDEQKEKLVKDSVKVKNPNITPTQNVDPTQSQSPETIKFKDLIPFKIPNDLQATCNAHCTHKP